MHVALNEKLASLPDDTVTYVGHEYTASNVAFSKKIEPDNKAIQELEQYCKENEVTTGKFTIGDEKKHNVFMRTNEATVQSESLPALLLFRLRQDETIDEKLATASEATNTSDPIKAMGVLREMKVRLAPSSPFTYSDTILTQWLQIPLTEQGLKYYSLAFNRKKCSYGNSKFPVC
jgi:hydroxyacylglutathione hydrolase